MDNIPKNTPPMPTLDNNATQNSTDERPIVVNSAYNQPPISVPEGNKPEYAAVSKSDQNRKILRIIILVIIVVITLIGIVVFFQSDKWVYKKWWTYEDVNYGYKFKLPPNWKEALGNGDIENIKHFDLIKTVEINDPMIAVFIHPVQKGQADEYRSLLSKKSGETVLYGNVSYLKVKNTSIDGCSAPMLFTDPDEPYGSPRYDAVCLGNKHSVTIRLSSGEMSDQHIRTYERAIKSFRFNNLRISDSSISVEPTPTTAPEWISYKNDLIGFQLERPGSWSMFDDTSYEQYDHYLQQEMIYFSSFDKAEISEGNASFVIMIFRDSSALIGLEDFVNQVNNQEKSDDMQIMQLAQVDFNGNNAVKEVITNKPNENYPSEGKLTLYYMEHPVTKRKFAIGYGYLYEQETDHIEKLEKTLASFKFLDSL